jgi:hypothetical protein
MHFLKIAFVTATILGGVALVGPAASAIPMNGLAAASNELPADVKKVVWLCGPFRCWWRPNYWGFYRGHLVWGPRYYWLNPHYY